MKVTVYTIFDQLWKYETLLLSSTFHSTTVKSLKLLLNYCRSQIYSGPFIKASVMYGTNREMSHFVMWRWVMSLLWVSCLPDPDMEELRNKAAEVRGANKKILVELGKKRLSSHYHYDPEPHVKIRRFATSSGNKAAVDNIFSQSWSQLQSLRKHAFNHHILATIAMLSFWEGKQFLIYLHTSLSNSLC